jgi:hypothetical protein
VNQHNLQNMRHSTLPLQENVLLTPNKGMACEIEIAEFREILRSLLYFSKNTCPDICLAVALLSRHMTNPGKTQKSALIKLFRYLSSTQCTRLFYPKIHKINMKAYTDSTWATNIEDGTSTSGYFQINCSRIVRWHFESEIPFLNL